jgi:hypothetical protein
MSLKELHGGETSQPIQELVKHQRNSWSATQYGGRLEDCTSKQKPHLRRSVSHCVSFVESHLLMTECRISDIDTVPTGIVVNFKSVPTVIYVNLNV